MSLLHGDKSVFPLHLKKIVQDHHEGDGIALISLGAIMVGTVMLPKMVRFGKPILKSIIKSGLTFYPQNKPISSSKLEFQKLKLISPKGSDWNLN